MDNHQTQVNTKSSLFKSPTLQKMIFIYTFAFIEMTVLYILTFSETIYKKLTTGVWEQHGLILQDSMGLTAHVITAVLFVVLFLTQVMFGIFQSKYNKLAKMHIKLGRIVIFYTIIFLVMAIWAVIARNFNNTSIEIIFYMDAIFIAIFVIRGFIAIKQKRYLDHIDSMLGAFVVTARSAMFRFSYILIVAIYGSSPIKVGELAFIINIILYLNLALFYFLANRWKNNKFIVLSQLIFSSVLLAVVIILNMPIAYKFFE